MPYIDPASVLWKEIDEKVVVLCIETGVFYELNTIGSEIWRQLAVGKDSDVIIQSLREVYAVPDKALAADVETFIKRMAKEGLLQK